MSILFTSWHKYLMFRRPISTETITDINSTELSVNKRIISLLKLWCILTSKYEHYNMPIN